MHLKRTLIIACLCTVFVGCATEIYKEEVSLFSQGVGDAVAIVEHYQKEQFEKDTNKKNEELAKQASKIDETDACQDILERMRKDIRCAAEWVDYQDGKGSKPSCKKPSGYLMIPSNMVENCQIGVYRKGAVHPEDLEVDQTLTKTVALGQSLKAYTDALTEITSAGDIESLKKGAAKFNQAMDGLINKIEEQTGEETKFRSAVGPVFELVQTIGIASLEAKKHRVMKRVVNRADPIIMQSSKILSINTAPFTFSILSESMEELASETDDFFGDVPHGEDYNKNLSEVQAAHKVYITLLNSDPSEIFKKMAEAHSDLKKALNDPSRQFGSVVKSVSELVEKAKAARDAIESL